MVCIVAGGDLCVAIWRSKAVIQRCDKAAVHCDIVLRYGAVRARHGARQGLGRDTIFGPEGVTTQ